MAAAADRVRLTPSWKAALASEFESAYMARLRAFLVEEKQARKTVYPKGDHIFRALDATPLESVKVVIIGQDPYHGPRQAHGLCFSVQPGVALPPSLVNIFAEINTDMADDDVPCGRHDGAVPPGKGCLAPWSRQGVLLLNAVLTVVAGRAGSHQGRGWETFTDRVVEIVNRERQHVVFMLWGSYAQKKGAVVDTSRHLVLTSPHPSPLSAHRGFFGCRHFSKANTYLVDHGVMPINWFDVE
ncbi:MAG: uracil-DNA glycosylase [Gammaproteobacteria bacterium]|nr:uracil-DNA glycosylase [Gammaproteobacteria bacterium]MYJ74917.1 uracil-DNA glycosylase [Gammaproteobacteria bacterium]